MTVVFDFDRSLLHENDVDSQFIDAFVPVAERQRLREEHAGWNTFVDACFAFAHDHGVTRDQIIAQLLSSCRIDARFVDAIRVLRQRGVRVLILSDGNELMIRALLTAAELQVDDVLTNPSFFDDAGRLHLRPFHEHQCLTCPPNLCKTKALLAACPQARIAYVGDGRGDACPIRCVLRQGDLALVRADHPLDRLLEDVGLTATKQRWADPTDVCEALLAMFA